mmetsp:Transcript_34892/g.76539  ORF Transcript_34892/g.76539 Transcript_34892/m.76539 type:complete len:225 (+) Transcript_34892:1-675(+)
MTRLSRLIQKMIDGHVNTDSPGLYRMHEDGIDDDDSGIWVSIDIVCSVRPNIKDGDDRANMKPMALVSWMDCKDTRMPGNFGTGVACSAEDIRACRELLMRNGERLDRGYVKKSMNERIPDHFHMMYPPNTKYFAAPPDWNVSALIPAGSAGVVGARIDGAGNVHPVNGASYEVTCSHCGRNDAPVKRCTRCWKVRYCSRQCQKVAWKHHKRCCKRSAAESNAS